MHILADNNGKISHIAMIPIPDAVEYTGVTPDDLLNTFALGKYTFVNGQIVEVTGWVAPAPVPSPIELMQQRAALTTQQV